MNRRLCWLWTLGGLVVLTAFVVWGLWTATGGAASASRAGTADQSRVPEADRSGVEGATPAVSSFAEWQDAAHALPSAERAAALVEFLDGGADGLTGEVFDVGEGGRLNGAPTWRVAALDWLGEVDPVAAAAYARRIFAESDSPDEWALALRNYGRSLEEPSRDSYYNARITDLLDNRAWRGQPTAGYLAAFDALVHSGRGEWALKLEELRADAASSRAVSRVSAMAYESLAERAPAAVVAALAEAGPAPEAARMLRVSAFARLDPADPAEAARLVDFLHTLAPEGAEARYFFDLFPNGNTFGGHHLLTSTAPPTLSQQARQDRAALALARQWQEGAELLQHRDGLRAMATRLEAHVGAARAGGYLIAD